MRALSLLPLLHLLPPLSAYDFFFVRAVRSYLTTAKSCALLHLLRVRTVLNHFRMVKISMLLVISMSSA